MLYLILGAVAVIIVALSIMNRISFNFLLMTFGFMPLLAGIRNFAVEQYRAKSEARKKATKKFGMFNIIIGVLIIIGCLFIKF